MNAITNWIEESKKFDQVAETYDLYRPSYPDALINKIIEKTKVDSTSKLLEIGSGSGKATELFVEKNLNIHCIEQGPNLVKCGISKFIGTDQVSFECVAFQDWKVELNSYDVAFSAQAFHWVPKPQGYKTLAKALKDKGQMMIFWNKYINNGDEISKELASILKENKILWMLNDKEIETYKNRTYDGIYTTDLFEEIEIHEYPWTKEYTYKEFINFLSTTNSYISLKSEDRHALNTRLLDVFSVNEDKITLNLLAILFSARKC